MYSVLTRKENAHDEAIWSCGWGRIQKKKYKEAEGESGGDDVVDYIVSAGADDLVKLWSYGDKQLTLNHTLTGLSPGVAAVAISSDGTKCASISSRSSSLLLWDVLSGTKLDSFYVGPEDIRTIAFSPDDRFIVTGSYFGKINMYCVELRTLEASLDTGGHITLSIAYSPDGKYIASGAVDGTINIFEVASQKLVHTLEGHAKAIRSLCFSPDSQLLLTASDGYMKLYEVKHANVVGTLSGHASWVQGACFSPDKKYVASCSSDSTVKVWDLKLRRCLYTFLGHSDQVWSVRYSPDGDKIVSVSDDKSIIKMARAKELRVVLEMLDDRIIMRAQNLRPAAANPQNVRPLAVNQQNDGRRNDRPAAANQLDDEAFAGQNSPRRNAPGG